MNDSGFTYDELADIASALRAKIHNERKAYERGETLGLFIDRKVKLFRKVESMMNAMEPNAE